MEEKEDAGRNTRIRRKCLEGKPDIIHSQCEFSTFPAARRLADALDIPVVHTCHTVYEEYTHYFSPRREWGKAFVRRAMIAPSEKTKNLLEEYGITCPIYVVPSGIELSEYAGDKEAACRERIRAEFSVSSGTTLLLYVGRLAKEKHIEELLRFQKHAREKQTALLIAGDGPHRRELERQVRLLGIEKSVIFTGMIPHERIGEYYSAGDLFVNASVSETQGMTYGEALASGLPLLCRKDDCLKGILREGENGWQYESAGEFQRFLADWMALPGAEKEKMRQSARQSAEVFSAESFARKAEAVYEVEKARHRSIQKRHYRE